MRGCTCSTLETQGCDHLGSMKGIHSEAKKDYYRFINRMNQKVLLVEGEKDKQFFESLFKHMNLDNQYRVYSIRGKPNLIEKIELISEIKNLQKNFHLGVADPDYEFLDQNYSRINDRIIHLKENNFETFLVYNSKNYCDQTHLKTAKMVAVSIGKLRACNYHQKTTIYFRDKKRLQRCMKAVQERNSRVNDYDKLVIRSFGKKAQDLSNDYFETIKKLEIPENNVDILGTKLEMEIINGKDLINLLSIQGSNFNQKRAMCDIISKFQKIYLFKDMVALGFLNQLSDS